MRSPRLLVLGLLGLLLVLAVPASAASPTLTVSPTSGPKGTKVRLMYHLNVAGYSCSGGHVDFSYDAGQQPFATTPLTQSCTAQASFVIPVSSMPGVHRFYGRFTDANGGTQPAWTAWTTFAVTLPVRTPSPTPSPTASPTPSPTASPTPSPTPTATPSATPSAVPAALPTPSPTATALPVATVPPGLPSGGSSGTPWVVGGALLGLAGAALGAGVLRARGAGTPVWVGVTVVSVLAGTGLALKPLTDPVTPLVLGTYAAEGGQCADGDLALSGGFHVLDTPPVLLHHEPAGDSWDAAPSGTGTSYAVCLHLSAKVPYQVRTATLGGDPPHAGVSCQTPEQLLGGGFYVPWGLAGRQGSHPEAPSRWAAVVGPEPADLPAINATVSALCAELPDGIKTYTTLGSTAVSGVATARCFPGDVVLNGGYAAGEVRGSHPIDGGWQAEVGFGGGTAYALCVKPSRALGIRSTYVRQTAVTGEYQAGADCDAGGQVLGGGWTSGGGLSGLQHFRPDGAGWVVALPERGDVTSYALCAKRYS